MIYVVQCFAGKEYDVKFNLERLGYKVIVPRKLLNLRKKGKWITLAEILMPGYVFLDYCFGSGKLSDHDYIKVKLQNHVIRFLGTGYPEPLSDDEEHVIRWLANEGKPLEASGIEIGAKVRVICGPLVGREGEIVDINPRQRRCKIKVTTLDVTHEISLSIDIIREEQAQAR